MQGNDMVREGAAAYRAITRGSWEEGRLAGLEVAARIVEEQAASLCDVVRFGEEHARSLEAAERDLERVAERIRAMKGEE